MIVYLRMQNEGIPSGDKLKKAIKERFLQAIKKSIRVCLRVLFIPKGYHHFAFSILHSLRAKRSFIALLRQSDKDIDLSRNRIGLKISATFTVVFFIRLVYNKAQTSLLCGAAKT